jgi:hypothetical protein
MLKGGFDDGARKKLRKAYESGGLEDAYAELAVDDEAAAAGVAEGTLVIDERLKRVLPLFAENGDAPETPLDALAPEDAEAERADVTFEGMRSITRHTQVLMRQREKLKGRLDQAQQDKS